MGGLINIYDDIAKYWELRKVINLKDNAADRFLTGVNPKATRQEFFYEINHWARTKLDISFKMPVQSMV